VFTGKAYIVTGAAGNVGSAAEARPTNCAATASGSTPSASQNRYAKKSGGDAGCGYVASGEAVGGSRGDAVPAVGRGKRRIRHFLTDR
jgi:hypothetical protein